jgi:hypothetical protein
VGAFGLGVGAFGLGVGAFGLGVGAFGVGAVGSNDGSRVGLKVTLGGLLGDRGVSVIELVIKPTIQLRRVERLPLGKFS